MPLLDHSAAPADSAIKQDVGRKGAEPATENTTVPFEGDTDETATQEPETIKLEFFESQAGSEHPATSTKRDVAIIADSSKKRKSSTDVGGDGQRKLPRIDILRFFNVLTREIGARIDKKQISEKNAAASNEAAATEAATTYADQEDAAAAEALATDAAATKGSSDGVPSDDEVRHLRSEIKTLKAELSAVYHMMKSQAALIDVLERRSIESQQKQAAAKSTK